MVGWSADFDSVRLYLSTFLKKVPITITYITYRIIVL